MFQHNSACAKINSVKTSAEVHVKELKCPEQSLELTLTEHF